jgi:hypothetical protein
VEVGDLRPTQVEGSLSGPLLGARTVAWDRSGRWVFFLRSPEDRGVIVSAYPVGFARAVDLPIPGPGNYVSLAAT